MNSALGKIFLILTACFLTFVFVSNGYSQSLAFEEALKKAKEENKKVIIDVYTDWCGWCKKMDRDAYSNSDVNQIIDDNFLLVRLNAESSEVVKYAGKRYSCSELAAYFQVSGYPTTVFLNPDGSVIEFTYNKFKMNNLPGYYSASDFKKMLQFIKDERYNDTDLSTIL